jgi:hypothetical protein
MLLPPAALGGAGARDSAPASSPLPTLSLLPRQLLLPADQIQRQELPVLLGLLDWRRGWDVSPLSPTPTSRWSACSATTAAPYPMSRSPIRASSPRAACLGEHGLLAAAPALSLSVSRRR